MYCSRCGTERFEGEFCSACGADVTAPPGTYGDVPQVTLSPRDMATEGHLAAMGMWNRLGGVFLILCAVVMLLGSVLVALQGGGSGRGGFVVWLMFALTIVIGLMGTALDRLGTGLADRSQTARIIAGVLAILGGLGGVGSLSLGASEFGRGGAGGAEAMLVGGAISLAYQLAMAWILFSSRAAAVTSARYREIVAGNPSHRPRIFGSIFFWIPIVGALAVVGILALVSFMNINYPPNY